MGLSLFTRLSKWANMGLIYRGIFTLEEILPRHRYAKERDGNAAYGSLLEALAGS